MNKKIYTKNYKVDPNDKKKLIYIGEYHILKRTPLVVPAQVGILLIDLAIGLCLFGAGWINTQAGHTFYVLPFYAALWPLLAVCLYGEARVFTAPEELTADRFRDLYERPRKCGIAMLVLAPLMTIGQIVLLSIGGIAEKGNDIAFLIYSILISALCCIKVLIRVRTLFLSLKSQ